MNKFQNYKNNYFHLKKKFYTSITEKFIFQYKLILIILLSLSLNQTINSQESTKLINVNLKFYVTHPWKKVVGTCNDLKIDRNKISQNGPVFNISTPYNISCPLLKMKTGDSNRDSHMIEVLGFPSTKEISFNITKVKPNGDKKYLMDVDLTINSIKKMIQINVTEDSTKQGRIFGDFEVLLSDYSVERPSLLFVPIENKVKLEFEIFL